MSVSFSFYGISGNFERVLISLLEKSLELGKKSLIYLPNKQAVLELDQKLWNFSGFFPHLTEYDPYAEKQNILLVQNPHNINGSSYLFLIGQTMEGLEEFERCFFLFKKNNEEEKIFAEKYIQELQSKGYNVIYYEQDNRGRFSKNV